MKRIRVNRSRTARRAGVAAAAAVAAAAFAAEPATAGARVHAAPPDKADKPGKLKAPKIKHRVLQVEGTNDDDTIVLRLAAGSPGKLQVDGGAVAFTFDRSDFSSVEVDARKGDDTIRIDDGNGVF